VDAIVCVDANFTQKQRKSQGKAWVPPRQHCESVFISPTEVGEMENLVDEIRNPQSGDAGVRARNQGHINSEPDFEPGLRVPTVILDACNDSFVAADSNCVKASTSFFADTGLMALLC